jgi:hypothetical protein
VAGDVVRVTHAANPNVDAITIDAAIPTLPRSFMVDNYNTGSTNRPYLSVHGSITQRYRGIVGRIDGAVGH